VLTGYLEAARLGDLTPARVQEALATLRLHGRSLATCNHHRTAIRGFTRWAWKDGRLRDDPLNGVTGFNAKEDRRHDRRTLAVDDLRRLIDAAERGPTFQRMTGPARALCYRLAVSTGLRYSEIKSITPASLDLTDAHPTVTVAAGYTKNGEPATLPLPPDVSADLRHYAATIPAGQHVFPLPAKGAAMVQVDLLAAKIPYRDQAGLVFDFHALRCQCATLADQAGVSPRIVQKMMRHSTLELTGRYTRPHLHDMEGTTASLPNLRPAMQGSEAVSATGTDGPISDPLSLHLPCAGDGEGRIESESGGILPTNDAASMEHKALSLEELDAARRDLTASGGSAPRRTRTFNPLIKSQVSYVDVSGLN
jgi:integrase